MIAIRNGESNILLTFVYAKSSRVERQELWQHLLQLSQLNGPWIIGGDFNTILNATEKKGGLEPDMPSMDDFHECLLNAQVSDIGYEGNQLTWSNNQKKKRA